MRDVFAHTSAWWGKYSGYVWKTAPDGHCYLHPAQNAKPGVYDPMKDSRSIVLDALEIGLMQFRHAGESELKAAIHSFAEKYGLLGIMTALPTTARFFDYEKVYLPKNEFLREESMDTMDYIRLFFPFAMRTISPAMSVCKMVIDRYCNKRGVIDLVCPLTGGISFGGETDQHMVFLYKLCKRLHFSTIFHLPFCAT